MRNQRNQARHHVGLILAFVGLISGATLALKPARLASAQAVPPSWSFTGNLNAGRDSHTATLLPNGKVLMAGGNYTYGGVRARARSFMTQLRAPSAPLAQ